MWHAFVFLLTLVVTNATLEGADLTDANLSSATFTDACVSSWDRLPIGLPDWLSPELLAPCPPEENDEL